MEKFHRAGGGERDKKNQKKTPNLLLRINLKPDPDIHPLILHILIHPRRTEPILQPTIPRPLDPSMLLPILNLQMHRLVLLMVRPRAAHAGQDIEANPMIRLGVFDPGTQLRHLRSRVIRARVPERPRRAPAQHERLERRIHNPAVEAQGGVERRPHVADLLQFLPDGRLAQRPLVVVQEDGAGVFGGGEGRVGGLGGQHAGAHGRVGAFDFGDVQEAGGVADEGAAGEGALGDGLEAAFVEGAGAVGEAFATVEDGRVERVVFHFLEFAVGGEPGVGVVETDDEADGDQVVAEVVHPAAAVGVFGEGIAHRVGDFAFAEVFGQDLPDLFEAESVGLRLAVAAEVVFLDDLF